MTDGQSLLFLLFSHQPLLSVQLVKHIYIFLQLSMCFLKSESIGSNFSFSHVSGSNKIIQGKNWLVSQARESEKCQGPGTSVHFLFNHIMQFTISDV